MLLFNFATLPLINQVANFNNQLEVTQHGIDLIKKYEGCPQRRINGEIRAVPYLDPVGIPTLGYGRVISWDEYRRLKKVGISLSEAEENLKEDVARFSKGVKKLTKVPLKDYHLDALSSFTYNVGLNAYKKSTMLRKLNAKNYSGAANEFPRWVYANKKKLKGLVNRRQAERKMFLNQPPRD